MPSTLSRDPETLHCNHVGFLCGQPMTALTPHRFMPYGCFREAFTPDERYRDAPNGLHYRLTMPAKSTTPDDLVGGKGK